MSERRKQATLLFCDLSGSTSMGEELDPESVRELMFRYFHQMRSAIEGHGGTVEKFIGDAVMAVFGVPKAHEDDALRAVRASAEMRERLGTLNEELDRRFGRTISLRIGVNTGEVVAGDPATAEAVVTGDAVNVAARLEQAASPGEILIGRSTMELVRGAVSVAPAPPISAKGKSEPVAAFRLVSVAPAAVPIRQARRAPFVGRRDELAALDAEFATVRSTGSCRLVTIVGEPGVGKSRLAAEFLRVTAEQCRVVHGRCLAYGEGITYWPLVELVRDVAGILDEDTPDHARGRIVNLFGDLEEREVAAGYLATAVGLSRGDASAAGIAWACRLLFETVARQRPLVAVMDDIHWAEEPLLDLIRNLERHATGSILVLCLARPELTASAPGWQVGLRLEPLDTEQIADLVERLLGGTVPGAVTSQIATTSGGNALFAEELVAKLRDDGILERRDGTWVTARDPSTIQMPSTLTAVLTDRLDRLRDDERNALELGSIEGEVFHRGAVAAIGERPIADSVATLDRLTGLGLLRPVAASFADDAAFRFRHILLRDAAYASLPKRTRASLHERFADWLEATTDRIEEYEEILGYHLERAYRFRTELWAADEDAATIARRAAERLTSAGRRAIGRRDHHAAVSLLGRALELLDQDGEGRPEVMADLADVLVEAGEFARADDLHTDVIDRAEATGNRALRIRAELRMLEAGVHAGGRRTEDALREAEELLAACEKLADDRLLGHAWALIGRLRFWRGAAGSSEVAYTEAIEHARRAGDRRRETETLAWLIGAKAHGSTPAAEGIAFCDEVLASEPEDPLLTLFAFEKRGWFEAMQGRFEEARGSIERSRQIAETFDLKVRLGMNAFYRASIEMLSDGDLDRAERELREADELLGSLGETAFRSSIALCLARVLARRGRIEEAARVLGTETDDDGDFEATAFRARLIAGRGDPSAGVIARRGDIERAVALAKRTADDARASDYLDARGETLVDLAEVLLIAGRRTEAEGALREAVEVHERKGNVVSAERARTLLATVAGRDAD